MKTRIVFACGMGELVTCSWVIDRSRTEAFRNVLVLYGQQISMPIAHVRETLRLAKFFTSWDKIYDLTGASDAIAGCVTKEDANYWLMPLLHEFSAAAQILIHTLWKLPEKHFLDACPKAEIILFDNGLDSHLPRVITSSHADFESKTVRAIDISRVKQAFYTLGDYLDIPDFITAQGISTAKLSIPDGRSLRDHLISLSNRVGLLRELEEHLSMSPAQSRSQHVLLIGTSFFRTNRITREEEIRVYENVLGNMANLGMSTLFKEHPRAPSQLAEIKSHGITVRSSIPVELIPLITNIQLTASISSSALLTMKKIWDIPYHLFGDDLMPRLKLPWMDALRKYADEKRAL